MNLLDTSVLLWTLAAPSRLSQPARDAVAVGNPVLSVASYWEVVIKTRKGLLPIADPVSWWARATQLLGGRVLPIRASHVTALARAAGPASRSIRPDSDCTGGGRRGTAGYQRSADWCLPDPRDLVKE